MNNKMAIALFIFLLMQSKSSFEQSMDIYNTSIHLQADSLKNAFKLQGFAVVKEASMAMESQYEMPIIVQLKEGSWYRVIFIGDISSKL